MITGLFASNTIQVPSTFLTAILYVPAARFENVLPTCQFVPPSIENSTPGFAAKVATIEI